MGENVDIQIDPERLEYQPGETVSGKVTLIPKKDVRCRSATVQLEWHTTGRGNRDKKVIASKTLASGGLTSGRVVSDVFSFPLPDAPWSYNGHYINIVWAIKVNIDVPFAGDIEHARPIVSSPDVDAPGPAR